MENNNPFDYNYLIKKGLTLSGEDFSLIHDSLITGANEAKKYLNVSNDLWPKFNFSNDSPTLGYNSLDDTICLSLNHINQAASRSTPLKYKDQLIMFMPDKFYIIVKYISWLKLLGREATIHRYQKIGNPLLYMKFPETLPSTLSTKLLIFSDVEVEARTVNDKIAAMSGEKPIWIKVNAYFSENYPQYYNKSIMELAKFPKPDLPISFEMEFYAL